MSLWVFFHNAKKQEAISVINETVLVDLITPSIRGAKQFSVNFDEIRIDEPLDGEHETHGKELCPKVGDGMIRRRFEVA
jgi:hypothetical protein